MRTSTSLLALAFSFFASGLRAEPLQLTGHWAIYLPETEEVEFRARFNREPDFSDGDLLSFQIRLPEDDAVCRNVARIHSPSIIDDTIGIEPYLPDPCGTATEVDRVPFRVADNVFSVFVPFASIQSETFEFYYLGLAGTRRPDGVFESIGGWDNYSQIGVPEPPAFSLAMAAFVVLSYAVPRRQNHPRLSAISR